MSTQPLKDRVKVWIFDLDNTVYPPSSDLFPQIDARMKAFISDLLDLDHEAAFKLQKKYYHEHGTTLRGLMLNNAVSPESFLDYVHDIDHSTLPPDPALAAALARLGGRRVIYTNGSKYHAEKVLNQLGITDLFAEIFDITTHDYRPKPDPEPYREVLRQLGVPGTDCAMFEDIERNLEPAEALGMTTVFVTPEAATRPKPPHCTYMTGNLTEWLLAHAV